MSAELRQRIADFARSHQVLSLATRGPQGPWAAALFYAADAKLDLYFISDPAARHCREIESDPRVAVTINRSDADWTTVRGLQIEARANVVAAEDRARIEALYLERFPDIQALVADPRSDEARTVAGRFAASAFYRIAPQRIRLIDNRRGFGHREELEF